MNKKRRQEIKMLKYKKRLKNLGLMDLNDDNKANLYALRSHGKPCSCGLCRNEKYSRKIKHKNAA